MERHDKAKPPNSAAMTPVFVRSFRRRSRSMAARGIAMDMKVSSLSFRQSSCHQPATVYVPIKRNAPSSILNLFMTIWPYICPPF